MSLRALTQDQPHTVDHPKTSADLPAKNTTHHLHFLPGYIDCGVICVQIQFIHDVKRISKLLKCSEIIKQPLFSINHDGFPASADSVTCLLSDTQFRPPLVACSLNVCPAGL